MRKAITERRTHQIIVKATLRLEPAIDFQTIQAAHLSPAIWYLTTPDFRKSDE
jgi:hypothetical protein